MSSVRALRFTSDSAHLAIAEDLDIVSILPEPGRLCSESLSSYYLGDGMEDTDGLGGVPAQRLDLSGTHHLFFVFKCFRFILAN
jgi:hypothetical protein